MFNNIFSKNDITPRLSKKERREIRIKESNPRESYRNYSPKKYPYFLLIFNDIIVFVCFFCIMALMLSFPGLFIYGFIRWADILSKTVFFVIIIFLTLRSILSRPLKRIGFLIKLNRVCKSNQISVQFNRFPLKSIFSFSNKIDFSVHAKGISYDVMFMPARRKLIKFSFEVPGQIKIITGFIKSNIKNVLGIKPRIRIKKYGFEAHKTSIKVLLINPAPLELYYFDKKENKIIPGGTGAEFFGYTVYSGTGFINALKQQSEI